MRTLFVSLAVLFVCGGWTASAQSLAEVARNERERRARLKARENEGPQDEPSPSPRKASHAALARTASLSAGGLPTAYESAGSSPTFSAATTLDVPLEGDSALPDPVLEARADAAFEAGNPARALALYEQVLKRAPGSRRALYRSAKLLSWEKRYQESIDRYDRLLAIIPGQRNLSLEKGNVLLWARQFDRAAAVFRDLLAVNPLEREARLGLARSLAAAGALSEARAEFREVHRANPRDIEALVGIAQTYHWAGAGEIAREWYEKILSIEPGQREAEIGLGYLEIWSDPAAAEERALRLESRFPDNEDVKRLRAESRRAQAPSLTASYDQMSDSNGNQLGTTRFEAGFGLRPGMNLLLAGGRYAMSFDGPRGGHVGSGHVDSVYASVGLPTGQGQKLVFRLGADRLMDTAGLTQYVAIGGASWVWGEGRRWQGKISLDRDPYLYTTEALDNRILVNSFAASATGRFADDWFVDGEVGLWDISDVYDRDNSRRAVQAGLRYRTRVRRLPVEAGYVFQYFRYSQNWGASFFSPSFYRSHRGRLKTFAEIGSRFDLDVSVEAGAQSYDFVSAEPMVVGTAAFGLRLGGGYRLEIFGIRGDYLLLSDLPINSEQVGVRLRWKGGQVR